MKVTLPLSIVADILSPGRPGNNQAIAVVVQVYDDPAGDGQVNVQMLVKLTTAGVQSTEDTDLPPVCGQLPQHGAEQSTERGPLLFKTARADGGW